MDDTPARLPLPARLSTALRDWWAYMTCAHYWHAYYGAVWRCCGCGRDRARPPRPAAVQGVCACTPPAPAPRHAARPTMLALRHAQ